VPVTLADAANTVARATSESADAASAEPAEAAAGRIAVAAAAVVLPVLWGLAVHLIFNWMGRRRVETFSEEPVIQDYQI